MVFYFLLQLPQAYSVQVDIDCFFSSFTMLNDSNERVRIQIWELAPGHCVSSDDTSSLSTPPPVEDNIVHDTFVDQEAIRLEMQGIWDRYYRHTTCHIPYAVCKMKGESPLGADELGIQPGGLDSGTKQTGDEMEEADNDREPEVSAPADPIRPPGGCPNGTQSILILFVTD